MNITPVAIVNEQNFEAFLPKALQEKSGLFFTPERVAVVAANWLTGEDKRQVLDIGAGVGKFCLFGAHHTGCKFVGIEMRRELVNVAARVFDHFGVQNASVLHGNITDFGFADFSAFYFYNPFEENLVPELKLDDSILLAQDFYHIYTQHTWLQLSAAPKGTRLATYHGSNFNVPMSYSCIETHANGKLRFWTKNC
jgi:hypothetical protein